MAEFLSDNVLVCELPDNPDNDQAGIIIPC